MTPTSYRETVMVNWIDYTYDSNQIDIYLVHSTFLGAEILIIKHPNYRNDSFNILKVEKKLGSVIYTSV